MKVAKKSNDNVLISMKRRCYSYQRTIKLMIILLLLIPMFGTAQMNEFVTLVSTTVIEDGEAFQFKYERPLWGSFDFQGGLRYQNNMDYVEYNSESKSVRYSYNSFKFDFSVLLIPINFEHFKLKTGVGFDVGFSEYSETNRGIQYYNIYYWNADVLDVIDLGIHFIIQGNYYFDNNVFVSGQLLYNEVFNPEITQADGGIILSRQAPFNVGVGVGFRF